MSEAGGIREHRKNRATHFGDASTHGYGACSYLRIINENGDIHSSLLLSKARVGPLKTVSVPRLELQAAVLAVNLRDLLREELQLKVDQEYF